MIDTTSEILVPVQQVPDHLPQRRGKKTNIATVYRWITKGSRGRKLESVLIGGGRYTSVEALHRFFRSVTAAAEGQSGPTAMVRDRKSDISRAEKELSAHGI